MILSFLYYVGPRYAILYFFISLGFVCLLSFLLDVSHLIPLLLAFHHINTCCSVSFDIEAIRELRGPSYIFLYLCFLAQAAVVPSAVLFLKGYIIQFPDVAKAKIPT